jgi:hypothetical protein
MDPACVNGSMEFAYVMMKGIVVLIYAHVSYVNRCDLHTLSLSRRSADNIIHA